MNRHALTRTCQCAIPAALIAASLCACLGPAEASDTPPASRVRDNGDAAIAALLREARERSVTFRLLLETINGTDGVVYVEQGKCRYGERACLLMSVTVAGPNRILRVRIDIARDQAAIIGSLGHELQHVIEVLREPAVRTNALMYAFYEHLTGSLTARGQLAFETEAAVTAGVKVREEFEKSQRHSR